MEYVVIIGLFSAPVVTAFVIKNYPVITNKIAPIIAMRYTTRVIRTSGLKILAIIGAILFVITG